ncbi:MAG: phytochelatin synthase family protein [Phyllobacterium sp.]|uniref:phytochelatin synthase family protein n=1 Tax=Phyllobacterium sp. TaxID=1871046 RepID=UPI0030F22AAD
MRRVLVAAAALLVFLSMGTAVLVTGQTGVPAEAIANAVTRSPDLLARAWQLPVARTFKTEVIFQSNPSTCGPASVANVFRSVGEKGMTEAAVLEGTGRCWTGFCIMGLTLDELAGVARQHTDRNVTVIRGISAEEFFDHMRHSNDPDRRYIINFTRNTIFGDGAGHFSPIAGYLAEADMVFVLDVNEDYRPWLVERERLFSAMDTFDGDKKRGLLLIQ